jgi:hypothetical protein
MPTSMKDRGRREMDSLTTVIKEMASAVGAEFEVDERKAQAYLAAKERRARRYAASRAA